jgi:hypothetical protein
MAEEPFPPDILDNLAKALKERNDRELKIIQDQHDQQIKNFRKLYDDIIKDKLQAGLATERQNIIKEQTAKRDQRIEEMNRNHARTVQEKKDNYPTELDRYTKEQENARRILKHLEEQSSMESLKPDQPRR